MDRANIPENIKPEAGMVLQMERPDGVTLPVLVKNVTDEKVTMDANHPLAGSDLTFEIELVEIV